MEGQQEPQAEASSQFLATTYLTTLQQIDLLLNKVPQIEYDAELLERARRRTSEAGTSTAGGAAVSAAQHTQPLHIESQHAGGNQAFAAPATLASQLPAFPNRNARLRASLAGAEGVGTMAPEAAGTLADAAAAADRAAWSPASSVRGQISSAPNQEETANLQSAQQHTQQDQPAAQGGARGAIPKTAPSTAGGNPDIAPPTGVAPAGTHPPSSASSSSLSSYTLPSSVRTASRHTSQSSTSLSSSASSSPPRAHPAQVVEAMGRGEPREHAGSAEAPGAHCSHQQGAHVVVTQGIAPTAAGHADLQGTSAAPDASASRPRPGLTGSGINAGAAGSMQPGNVASSITPHTGTIAGPAAPHGITGKSSPAPKQRKSSSDEEEDLVSAARRVYSRSPSPRLPQAQHQPRADTSESVRRAPRGEGGASLDLQGTPAGRGSGRDDDEEEEEGEREDFVAAAQRVRDLPDSPARMYRSRQAALQVPPQRRSVKEPQSLDQPGNRGSRLGVSTGEHQGRRGQPGGAWAATTRDGAWPGNARGRKQPEQHGHHQHGEVVSSSDDDDEEEEDLVASVQRLRSSPPLQRSPRPRPLMDTPPQQQPVHGSHTSLTLHSRAHNQGPGEQHPATGLAAASHAHAATQQASLPAQPLLQPSADDPLQGKLQLRQAHDAEGSSREGGHNQRRRSSSRTRRSGYVVYDESHMQLHMHSHLSESQSPLGMALDVVSGGNGAAPEGLDMTCDSLPRGASSVGSSIVAAVSHGPLQASAAVLHPAARGQGDRHNTQGQAEVSPARPSRAEVPGHGAASSSGPSSLHIPSGTSSGMTGTSALQAPTGTLSIAGAPAIQHTTGTAPAPREAVRARLLSNLHSSYAAAGRKLGGGNHESDSDSNPLEWIKMAQRQKHPIAGFPTSDSSSGGDGQRERFPISAHRRHNSSWGSPSRRQQQQQQQSAKGAGVSPARRQPAAGAASRRKGAGKSAREEMQVAAKYSSRHAGAAASAGATGVQTSTHRQPAEAHVRAAGPSSRHSMSSSASTVPAVGVRSPFPGTSHPVVQPVLSQSLAVHPQYTHPPAPVTAPPQQPAAVPMTHMQPPQPATTSVSAVHATPPRLSMQPPPVQHAAAATTQSTQGVEPLSAPATSPPAAPPHTLAALEQLLTQLSAVLQGLQSSKAPGSGAGTWAVNTPLAEPTAATAPANAQKQQVYIASTAAAPATAIQTEPASSVDHRTAADSQQQPQQQPLSYLNTSYSSAYTALSDLLGGNLNLVQGNSLTNSIRVSQLNIGESHPAARASGLQGSQQMLVPSGTALYAAPTQITTGSQQQVGSGWHEGSTSRGTEVYPSPRSSTQVPNSLLESEYRSSVVPTATGAEPRVASTVSGAWGVPQSTSGQYQLGNTGGPGTPFASGSVAALVAQELGTGAPTAGHSVPFKAQQATVTVDSHLSPNSMPQAVTSHPQVQQVTVAAAPHQSSNSSNLFATTTHPQSQVQQAQSAAAAVPQPPASTSNPHFLQNTNSQARPPAGGSGAGAYMPPAAVHQGVPTQLPALAVAQGTHLVALSQSPKLVDHAVQTEGVLGVVDTAAVSTATINTTGVDASSAHTPVPAQQTGHTNSMAVQSPVPPHVPPTLIQLPDAPGSTWAVHPGPQGGLIVQHTGGPTQCSAFGQQQAVAAAVPLLHAAPARDVSPGQQQQRHHHQQEPQSLAATVARQGPPQQAGTPQQPVEPGREQHHGPHAGDAGGSQHSHNAQHHHHHVHHHQQLQEQRQEQEQQVQLPPFSRDSHQGHAPTPAIPSTVAPVHDREALARLIGSLQRLLSQPLDHSSPQLNTSQASSSLQQSPLRSSFGHELSHSGAASSSHRGVTHSLAPAQASSHNHPHSRTSAPQTMSGSQHAPDMHSTALQPAAASSGRVPSVSILAHQAQQSSQYPHHSFAPLHPHAAAHSPAAAPAPAGDSWAAPAAVHTQQAPTQTPQAVSTTSSSGPHNLANAALAVQAVQRQPVYTSPALTRGMTQGHIHPYQPPTSALYPAGAVGHMVPVSVSHTATSGTPVYSRQVLTAGGARPYGTSPTLPAAQQVHGQSPALQSAHQQVHLHAPLTHLAQHPQAVWQQVPPQIQHAVSPHGLHELNLSDGRLTML